MKLTLLSLCSFLSLPHLSAGIISGIPTKLNASDAGLLDSFGYSVAMTGNHLIAGATNYDGPASNGGAVYVFERGSGNELSPIFKADSSASGAKMGTAVAAAGNILIAGAPFEDLDGKVDAGAVYVFDISTKTLLWKLTASDGRTGDHFGESVAIDGNIILIGAQFAEDETDDDAANKGAAYLFDASTGQQLHKLLPSTPSENALFGNAVAVEGEHALVTAKADGNDDEGAVYLFNTNTGSQVTRILPSSIDPMDFFGSSIAISEGLAVIGASGDDDAGENFGAAYLLDLTTTNVVAKLLPDSPGNFGASVALDNFVLVGSPNESSSAGSAYLFNRRGKLLEKITAFDPQAGDQFAFSLAIEGDHFFAGSHKDDDGASNSGSAYLSPLIHDAIDASMTGTDLQWESIPGTSYHIYQTSDLSNWPAEPAAELTATGTTTLWPDQSGAVRQFFRVRTR